MDVEIERWAARRKSALVLELLRGRTTVSDLGGHPNPATSGHLKTGHHRHRFESQRHATRVRSDWIQLYDHRRPHQALGIHTPANAYAFAA